MDTSVRTLLLNSSYEPIKIVSWQKALILWFQDKVEIVEYHSSFARSARDKFQLPSVLRLKRYVRTQSFYNVRFCRENVYLRDDYTCQYCAKRFLARDLTLDHVLPASKSGKKTWTNVVAACRPCNQRKSNRTPQSANMPLLKEPRAPSWLPAVEFTFNLDRLPETWLEYVSTPSLKTGS
ncbi:MAG: HNH endonuclease [Pseudobdellovibrionaceae bacterium]